MRAGLQLLALTFVRPGELRGATWARDRFWRGDLDCPVLTYDVAGLRRGEWRKQATIRLQVDERRSIEAIQASDLEDRPVRATRLTTDVPIGLGRTGERRENIPRVAPSLAGLRRTRSGATRAGNRALHLRVASAIQCRDPQLVNFNAGDGPVVAPLARQPRRGFHGVRIVPMNTRPASNRAGGSTAISLRRTSFSLIMIPSIASLFARFEARRCFGELGIR